MPTLTPTYRDFSTFRLAGIRRFHALDTAPTTIRDQWQDFRDSVFPGLKEATVTYGPTPQMDMPNKRFESAPATKSPTSKASPQTVA